MFPFQRQSVGRMRRKIGPIADFVGQALGVLAAIGLNICSEVIDQSRCLVALIAYRILKSREYADGHSDYRGGQHDPIHRYCPGFIIHE